MKDPKLLPVNLVADEKTYGWLLREHIYIPTTVPAGCFLERIWKCYRYAVGLAMVLC